MNKLDLILKAKQAIASDTKEDRIKRRERLRGLVKKHGYDAVSAATGWKISSISQYLRNQSPQISEHKLSQAENILNSI